MKKSVFISHSSKDKRIAIDLCARLEAIGIGCWIAPRDVGPGTAYGEAIIDALRTCAVCLLILSENSNRSDAVRNEIERAFSYQKLIVPLRVREVLPDKKLEFFISTAQWIDAFASPIADRVEYIAAVVQAAEQHLPLPTPISQREGMAARLELALERALRHKMLTATAAVVLLASLSTAGLVIQRQTQTAVQTASTEVQNAAAKTERASAAIEGSAKEVSEAGQKIGAIGGRIDDIEAGVREAKKETSSDPRKELANIGIAWDAKNLLAAMEQGDMRALDLFMRGGMSPIAPVSGCPALWYAIGRHAVAISQTIDRLVKAGLDVNAQIECHPSASSNYSGFLLSGALLYRNGEAVDSLLSHGAHVTADMMKRFSDPYWANFQPEFTKHYEPILAKRVE